MRYTQHSSVEKGHGRHEQRYVTVIENPLGLPEGWRDVAVVVQVNRERQWKGKTTSTTHYYIASRKESAQVMGHLVRKHWAIENELHWVLDVTFGEDANRTADRNASANLGVVRRTAIALLKQDDAKGSLRNKMHHAALDTAYLERVLRGNKAI